MALNYLGSKARIAPWILNQPEIKAVLASPHPYLVEAFVGTGEVMRLARSQYNGLTCFGIDTLQAIVDVVNALTVAGSDRSGYLAPAIQFLNGQLLKGEHLHRQPGRFTQEYAQARSYFSVDNALAIEHVSEAIRSPLVPAQHREALRGLLLLAADKVANTASVYAANLKKLKPSAKQALVLPWGFKDLGSGAAIAAWQKDVAFLEGVASFFWTMNGRPGLSGKRPPTVVYADPPYNQRDYGTYYHVLETISRWDLDSFTPAGKTGQRPKASRAQSPFCSKRRAQGAFAKLFEDAAALTTTEGSVFALSYSNEGLMPLETLQSMLAEVFENVDTRSTQIERFNSKAGPKAKAYVTEYLLVASKPRARAQSEDKQ